MTKKLVLFLSIMAARALAWGDTLQISCVPSTACTAGAITQITATSVFDLSNQGQPLKGEGYLGIAVPGSGWPFPPFQA